MRDSQGASAVTGAFLAVRREVFESSGGFDEIELPVAYGDIDFALKLRARGRKILWTPSITLRHHESKTRGLDHLDAEKRARNAAERKVMEQRWGVALAADPSVNPAWHNATLPFRLIAAPPQSRLWRHIRVCASANPWVPECRLEQDAAQAGTIRGVAAVYNRFEDLDERKAALDAWGRLVESLVRPAPSNVVPLIASAEVQSRSARARKSRSKNPEPARAAAPTTRRSTARGVLMSASPPELVAELEKLRAEEARLRAEYGDAAYNAAVEALPKRRRGPKKKAHESAMLQMAQIIATGASVRAASRVAANGDESLAESYRKEFPKDREKWLAAVQRPRGTLTVPASSAGVRSATSGSLADQVRQLSTAWEDLVSQLRKAHHGWQDFQDGLGRLSN